MTELHATVDERAAAAMASHTYAWRRQRQATFASDPVAARFWADTCAACLAELDELAAAGRAGLDARAHAPPPNDGIQRGNTDLPALSVHAFLR